MIEREELEEAHQAAAEVLGELAEGMSVAEVIRDLAADRALLLGELHQAVARLSEICACENVTAHGPHPARR